jgi:hypothetical protein
MAVVFALYWIIPGKNDPTYILKSIESKERRTTITHEPAETRIDIGRTLS